jgi:three-Cys-motif partner protein
VAQVPIVVDDLLETPEVGEWAAVKYEHVRTYAQLFARVTRRAWKHRVFLDLFAGAGRSRLRDSRRIVASSPTIALEIEGGFDHFIFCEAKEKKLDALRKRVERDHPSADARYILGDVNQKVDAIFEELPRHSPGERVLTLCFVDPYNLGALSFGTIRRLSERFMDFLVLIASGHDAHRNQDRYVAGMSPKLDIFLGPSAWREAWKARAPTAKFRDFVTETFGEQMARLGYIYAGLDQGVLVRSTEKNLHLYDLVLFSRSDLGERLWKAAKKASNPQQDLF